MVWDRSAFWIGLLDASNTTTTTSNGDAFNSVFCGSTAGVKWRMGIALAARVEVQGEQRGVGGLGGLRICNDNDSSFTVVSRGRRTV